MKKGFILYKDNYDPIKELTLEQKGELLDAIFEYNISGEIIKLSPISKMAFQFLKPQFDRDIEKYNNICDKNKENIAKRWNKKNTTVYDRIPSDTKNTHSHTDTDTDTDTDSHIDSHKDTKKEFPPSFSLVKKYCDERNNNINPQQFIDFYSSKGWMVGKNKMKDWKACIRTWETRDSASKKTPFELELEKLRRDKNA